MQVWIVQLHLHVDFLNLHLSGSKQLKPIGLLKGNFIFNLGLEFHVCGVQI